MTGDGDCPLPLPTPTVTRAPAVAAADPVISHLPAGGLVCGVGLCPIPTSLFYCLAPLRLQDRRVGCKAVSQELTTSLYSEPVSGPWSSFVYSTEF